MMRSSTPMLSSGRTAADQDAVVLRARELLADPRPSRFIELDRAEIRSVALVGELSTRLLNLCRQLLSRHSWRSVRARKINRVGIDADD